jgi:hypothetical protein
MSWDVVIPVLVTALVVLAMIFFVRRGVGT